MSPKLRQHPSEHNHGHGLITREAGLRANSVLKIEAMSQLLSSPLFVYGGAVGLRVFLLFYGLYQDEQSAFKYTDIDYFVFTDAARFVSQGRPPYDRDTYRYTPLLAWLLVPTSWSPAWFSFGKALFAVADIIAGYLITVILRSSYHMSKDRALKFASIWLLNPMVATISTRGSSEGLLGVLAVALLWAVTEKHTRLAGLLLGLSVHFKIYPFIYAFSIMWWLDDNHRGRDASSPTSSNSQSGVLKALLGCINRDRLRFAMSSFVTFSVLNYWMYTKYGWPFIEHSYLYHLSRVDHRHNFSPYNTMLYLNSSPGSQPSLRVESFAFLPQIILSAAVIPLVLAKKDLALSMLGQTFAFVTFNKVCTSQYFLWYLIFLPFYLPTSSLWASPKLGLSALGLWVAGQAFWLQQGYQLEFLGISTFVPGLWVASTMFFAVNCWILSIVVRDGVQSPSISGETSNDKVY